MQEPRAARETAILVAARNHRKAVRTLLAAFPHLRPETHDIGTKLCDPDPQGPVIDLLKSVQPILRRALVHTVTVKAERRSYLIPTLETALALVFGPMIALEGSNPDKYLHGHDFLLLIESNPEMDLKALAACGELLYKGGGAAIVDKVQRIRAGEKLNL